MCWQLQQLQFLKMYSGHSLYNLQLPCLFYIYPLHMLCISSRLSQYNLNCTDSL